MQLVFSTEKKQPVYSVTAFSITVVNEFEDTSNIDLYSQLIGQFEPAQYNFKSNEKQQLH